MKTTRCVLGALIIGGLFALEGCGAGQYKIPAVEPVVKPKPEDDLLGDIEGGDEASVAPAPAPSGPAPAEKAEPAKPVEAPKSEPAKPVDAKPAEAKPAEAPKPAAKPADAPKPAAKPVAPPAVKK